MEVTVDLKASLCGGSWFISSANVKNAHRVIELQRYNNLRLWLSKAALKLYISSFSLEVRLF
jgi:hypothetical protein